MVLLTTKEDSIREAVSAGLFNNDDAITALELNYEKLNKLKLTRKTILQDFEIVVTYDEGKFYKKDFENLKKILKKKKKE